MGRIGIDARQAKENKVGVPEMLLGVCLVEELRMGDDALAVQVVVSGVIKFSINPAG